MTEKDKPDFVKLSDLAEAVEDGQSIGVGGLHFVRIPVALLKALVASRRKHLAYVSWGGGLPLELLLAAGAIRKIVFCFSSLDMFGLAPLFRKALEDRAVEIEEWTALAMIQGFHAAQQKLPSLPFQLPIGSDMLDRSPFVRTFPDPYTEQLMGAARRLELDAFLLHAQRADEDGNVEIQGARGLDLNALGAAKKVLVTVEEIVPRGTFQTGPRAAVVPRTLVSAIARCPSGAYPTSCLPYYVTDYRALLDATARVPIQVPEPALDRSAFVKQAAGLQPSAISHRALVDHSPRIELDAPASVDELMVTCLARHYGNDSVCAAGAVSPLAIVSYLLAKRLHAHHLVLMTMSSGFVDVAVRPMLIMLAEAVDFRTAVLHCGGEDTYHWYYQPGLVTHEVVTAAQIDRYGRTNNLEITTPSGAVIRLPGQGGMADVANTHRNFLLYLTRHSPRTLVANVDHVSAARGLVADEERAAAGWQTGYVRLVTNLGMFELNKESGLLELCSILPGVSLDQVAKATGFPLSVAPKLSVGPAEARGACGAED